MNKQEARNELISVEARKLELEAIINAPEDLFSKIRTYSDVCTELGEKELTLEDFEHLPEYMVQKALAQAQIQQIEKLFNGNWVKDWTIENQPKFYPYYKVTANGLVFYGSDWDCSCAIGLVGFYKDRATSDFVGRTFINIYKKLI